MNKHLNGSRESITSILLILSFFVGCDYHVDSVYLGRNEAGFLENVCMGNIEAVNEFLDNGGNVNLQDEPGMTPLHHAVNSDWKESHLEMIKLLIERGAIVNAIDDTHHTPLHMASNATVAGLLLDAGADVNAKTESEGETLLFSAAWGAAQGASKSHQMYLDLTKLLLAKGANVNVKLREGSMIKDEKPHHAKSGDTVLHKVARSYSEKHASEICELLVASGSNINELNVKGQTPLDEALANDLNQTAETLLKLGAKKGKLIAIDSDDQ
jgi:ankyrin repeat protein